ncbi:hypothetical protein B566_EDAN007426 [Ephemera danica]|nr:hypothetical protein B566_EDAN007426 [Ephemera danica]
MVDFLTDEIDTEKKTHQKKSIPTELDGFKIECDNSEVTLTKKSGDERYCSYGLQHNIWL